MTEVRRTFHQELDHIKGDIVRAGGHGHRVHPARHRRAAVERPAGRAAA